MHGCPERYPTQTFLSSMSKMPMLIEKKTSSYVQWQHVFMRSDRNHCQERLVRAICTPTRERGR
jgi:hypothetical protein